MNFTAICVTLQERTGEEEGRDEEKGHRRAVNSRGNRAETLTHGGAPLTTTRRGGAE